MANDDPKTQTPGSEKLVPEKDMFAQKTRAEGLEQRLKEAEEASKQSVEQAKKELSEIHQRAIVAEAQAKELTEKLNEASSFKGELDKVKLERDAANVSVKSHQDKALDYRRKLVVATFNISADSVKEKTIEQLDAFEEALKAVQAQQGAKGYAAGGGGAGGGKAESDMDRARKTVADAYAKAGLKVPA